MSLPSGISIGGQTRLARRAENGARAESRALACASAALWSVSRCKLPAPLDKAADTPLPSWLDMQWPAGGGAQGRVALGSVLSGSYALDPDAKGMRLAHLALTFGGGESGSSDAQMVNVGGSVAAIGSGGMAAAQARREERQAIGGLSAFGKTQSGGARLPWPCVPRCFLGSGRHGGQLADCGVGGRMLPAPSRCRSARIRPSLGICNSTGCILTWRQAPNRRKAPPQPRTQAAVTDPRAMPNINFHAANVEWGERQVGDVQGDAGQIGRRHQPHAADRGRRSASTAAR